MSKDYLVANEIIIDFRIFFYSPLLPFSDEKTALYANKMAAAAATIIHT